jgi:hypothetical protein
MAILERHSAICVELTNLTSVIVDAAGKAIDEAVNAGHTLPITKLSESLATRFQLMGANVDKTLIYHLVSAYFKRRDDLYMKMGPGGGIAKKVADNAI